MGVENGDIADLSSTKTDRRKAFMGRCVALLQSTSGNGEIRVTVESDNLRGQECIIQSI